MALRHTAADQRTFPANPALVGVDHPLVRALPLPNICPGNQAGEDILPGGRGGLFPRVGAAVVGRGGGRAGGRAVVAQLQAGGGVVLAHTAGRHGPLAI